MMKNVDLILWWNKNNFQVKEELAFNNNLIIGIELDRKEIIGNFKIIIMIGMIGMIGMIEKGILMQGNNNSNQEIKIEIDNTTKCIYRICIICTITKWCNFTMGRMECLYLNHLYFLCSNNHHYSKHHYSKWISLGCLVHLNKYICHLPHQIIQFFQHSPQILMIPIKANDNMKYLFYIIMIIFFKLLSWNAFIKLRNWY